MSQINITPPASDDRGGAGVNFIAVILGVVVIVAIVWLLMRGGFGSGPAPAPANPSAPQAQPTTAAPGDQPTVVAPTVQQP